MDAQYEVYVISSAGGKPRRVTSNAANDHHSSFSRDGQWIYFSSNRTGEYTIWKVPFAGGDAVGVPYPGARAAVQQWAVDHVVSILRTAPRAATSA